MVSMSSHLHMPYDKLYMHSCGYLAHKNKRNIIAVEFHQNSYLKQFGIMLHFSPRDGFTLSFEYICREIPVILCDAILLMADPRFNFS